jgi:hypothetical protein
VSRGRWSRTVRAVGIELESSTLSHHALKKLEEQHFAAMFVGREAAEEWGSSRGMGKRQRNGEAAAFEREAWQGEFHA